MNDINMLVEMLVNDIEKSENVGILYEVWAVGYDEESEVTGTEALLGIFEDPKSAVSYAEAVTLTDVVNLVDGYYIGTQAAYISIEVETLVATEGNTMSVGTIYKNTIKAFE